ncbi:helix-turn-helix domain-containing protein [Haladaptatus salinisoli]|uniref:helix-turn-helix domain-containing protein n=1 Tax=Haladaptatus salinisoli TaxID=2884876 RepID=UPI001D0A7A96|nr:helix-turn-helix domain-containing protein [Haladaptatus salinisoli]
MKREAVVRIPTAEFSHPGLEAFISLCRDAGVKKWRPAVCTGPGGIVAIQVERPFDEEQLSALEYVAWWERTNQATAAIGYLIKLDISDLTDEFPPLHELNVSNEEITVNDHGLDISFVGTQEALSYVVSQYIDAGIPMDLRAITDYHGPTGVLDSLTHRQHEVVRIAYEMGYYEIPRRVSSVEVAAELDLDQSTVSEHLQRAERNLLRHVLDAD